MISICRLSLPLCTYQFPQESRRHRDRLSYLCLPMSDYQPFHGPRHRHIHQPSLLLQVQDRLLQGIDVGQDSLIETGNDHALEFQPLSLMDGHEIYFPSRR